MKQHGRIAFLDELRGLLLILMAIYHTQWNLQYMFGRPQDWFIGWPGTLIQVGTSTAFILLAGACTHFCRSPYKRSALMIGVAAAVTIVTTIIMYDSRIVFGILHLMAASQLLYTLCIPVLRKFPPVLGAALSAVLFLLTYHVPERIFGIRALGLCVPLPDAWYSSKFLSVLGFLSPDFFSADYFPVIPFVFAFFCGHFLGYWLDRIPKSLHRPHCRPLGWMGRHSLIIYLAHQPLILGAMMLIFG